MVQTAPRTETTAIRAEYEDRFAASRALHDRARRVIPGGISHDGRHRKPFPVSIERAHGARKWSVDGHELVDFAIGHGSLILGHNDPGVLAAVEAALPHGTHHAAGHEAEIAWAEQIARLVPSAERVKFTGSGTEATMLAMRLARAVTGKPTIVKFEGHFHGWHDYALKGEKPPFDAETVTGVPAAALGTVVVLPANDPDAVDARLAQGDVAGVILEPSGASWSTIPLDDGFLAGLRRLATTHGAVLIFDEVITGFRWAPGGAQVREGVLPDLTTLAKIVAGGFPGGAVCGGADFMAPLEFRDEPGWNATKKIRHQGTFNASPVVAAAGLEALRRCADPAVQARCDELAARLRAGFNLVLAERGVPGFAWGDSSVFHVALGESCANRPTGDLKHPAGLSAAALKGTVASPHSESLHLGMLIEGVDLFAGGGMFSVAHTETEVDFAIGAFGRVVARMAEEGAFG